MTRKYGNREGHLTPPWDEPPYPPEHTFECYHCFEFGTDDGSLFKDEDVVLHPDSDEIEQFRCPKCREWNDV